VRHADGDDSRLAAVRDAGHADAHRWSTREEAPPKPFDRDIDDLFAMPEEQARPALSRPRPCDVPLHPHAVAAMLHCAHEPHHCTCAQRC
jgi:hypothetical protein